MTIATTPRLYTVEEAKALDDAEAYELVDGILKEREVGAISSWVGTALLSALFAYSMETGQHFVFEAQIALHLFPERVRYFRRPDATVVLRSRFEDGRLPPGDLYLVPDLVAEVVSPNDLAYETEAKLQDYLAAGVRMIWFVYPETRSLALYRPGEPALRLSETDAIPGFDVLPGFEHLVGDLFPA